MIAAYGSRAENWQVVALVVGIGLLLIGLIVLACGWLQGRSERHARRTMPAAPHRTAHLVSRHKFIYPRASVRNVVGDREPDDWPMP